jgi:CNT family concentrative nucleoside transporter
MPAFSFGIPQLISVFGIGVIIGIAWLLSKDRSAVDWRIVKWGLGLQFVFAVLILGTGAGDAFFSTVDAAFTRLMSFAEQGMDFVFQPTAPFLEDVGQFGANGVELKETVGFPLGREDADLMGRAAPSMKTFAFWVLPTIIFFSALMSVLYHVGIMGVVVNFFGRLMHKTMGTSGAESMSAASNIFVGQTEAPLVVKPFIDEMTKSELHAVMTGGFATIAGGVMAMYVLFLNDIPGIAGHLVVASILSAPAALAIAKILYPEDGTPVTSGGAPINVEKTSQNFIEAAARGSSQGLQLALNVAAMLIAFIALVAMADWMLSAVPVHFCDGAMGLGYNDQCEPMSMSNGLGLVFSPLAWCMGIPWEDATTVGALLGEKMVLTELYAYQHFGEIQSVAETAVSERSAIITSYALCGFANFASIGIQIGGLGAIAPDRLRDISAVAFRAMIGGTLAAMMTGTVAGVLLS